MMRKLSLFAGIAGVLHAAPIDEFMRAMDEAKSDERRFNNLQKTLMEKAVLVSDHRRLEDVNDGGNAYSTLNLTSYAMKYIGCQNVKTFSDDLAENEDSSTVLGTERFVMFRFCNADICSNYNKYGCSYDFGEYVIEMEYYLETMATYHYNRYEEYCATCIACMNPSSDDDAAYNITDDDVVNNNITDDNGNCQYYEACYNYNEACSTYMTKSTQYEDFFTCTEFQVGQNVGYLGPHCSKNGKTIQIGIFEDEDCSMYIGDIVDLQQFTGMQFDFDGLAFYDSGNCISCISEEEYSLYTDDAAGNAVYELCEVLFEESGKCNRYYDVEDISSTYASYEQSQNEDKVCTFIESLVENNYNEYGEIILSNQPFDVNNWKDFHEYEKIVPEVTFFQAVGLTFSIFLVVFLTIYACYLHSKLRTGRYIPDSAGPDDTASEAGRISRMHSGIQMGRSTSGNEGVYA